MKVLSLDVLEGEQARLETWRVGNPLRAAVVFFALYEAVTGLSLPGATIVTLASGRFSASCGAP